VKFFFVIYAVSFEASAFACSLARRFGFVLFVAVGSAQFFHCNLYWPFYVSHLLALLADDRTDDA